MAEKVSSQHTEPELKEERPTAAFFTPPRTREQQGLLQKRKVNLWQLETLC